MRRILTLLFACLLLPFCVWGDITIGDTSPNSTGGVAATSLTTTHIGDACANALAVVGVATHAGTGVTSVTYNGVTMTPAVELYQSTNPIGGCGIYLLPNPGSGSISVIANFASTRAAMGVMTLCGAAQTGILGDTDSSGGTTNSRSVTVDSSATDLVVDFLQRRAVTDEPGVGAGQTQRTAAVTSEGSDTWGKMSTEPGGVATTTMGWSWTTSELNHLCAAVIHVAPPQRRGNVIFLD